MSGGSNDLIQRITNMQKRKLCIFVSGLLLMTSGLAMATPVVVDFDAALVSANQDPATCDGNGNGNGDPNGILDSDELAVLSWVLADVTRPHHNAVHAAYSANMVQLDADMTANPLANAYKPLLLIALSGYLTLGDNGGFARASAIVGQAGLVLDVSKYNQTQKTVLAFDADPDGDGLTNLQEYTAIAGTGGPASAKRTQYIHDVFSAPGMVVDFDAAMTGAGLNPLTTDGNGSAAGTPNGILDSDELAVLSFVLADSSNPYFASARAAYVKNLAQMNTDLGAPYAAVYGVPLAGYMTLGDTNTVARATAILMSVGKTLTLSGYDVSQSAVFAYNADPDQDMRSNLVEYGAISGTGGPTSAKRAEYITAVFTAYVNPACESCLPTSGTVAVGSNVCLGVPTTTGNAFQWYFNNVALADGRAFGSQCQWLHISNVQLADAGVYKCMYNDTAKAGKTYTTTLAVAAAVPASGTLALALLTGLLSACAALVLVRGKCRA